MGSAREENKDENLKTIGLPVKFVAPFGYEIERDEKHKPIGLLPG